MNALRMKNTLVKVIHESRWSLRVFVTVQVTL